MRRRKWLLFPLLLGTCLLVPIDKQAAQDHRAGQKLTPGKSEIGRAHV